MVSSGRRNGSVESQPRFRDDNSATGRPSSPATDDERARSFNTRPARPGRRLPRRESMVGRPRVTGSRPLAGLTVWGVWGELLDEECEPRLRECAGAPVGVAGCARLRSSVGSSKGVRRFWVGIAASRRGRFRYATRLRASAISSVRAAQGEVMGGGTVSAGTRGSGVRGIFMPMG